MNPDHDNPNPRQPVTDARHRVGIAASVLAVVVTPILLIWATVAPAQPQSLPTSEIVNPTALSRPASREERQATRKARQNPATPAAAKPAAAGTDAPAVKTTGPRKTPSAARDAPTPAPAP